MLSILKNNGLGANADSVLAGHMMNEGARNGRRLTLGNHFAGEAGKLEAQLKKSGLDAQKLAADPKARADLEKSLPEDQKFLLGRVISGEIDLAALNSKDPAVKKAAKDKVTEAGIDKRVEQFQEMESLKKAKADGKKLTKEETARLTQLQNMSGNAVGFDRVDAQINAKFDDMSGLSADRFREIYDEGQQRFEPGQYRRLRNDYDKNVGKYLKGDQKKALTVHASIGNANLSKEEVAAMQAAGNHDNLADMATSYGTAQIMGLYGHEGLLKAKDGANADVSYDMDDLKNSMHRMSPTTEDVNMQVAFYNMKAKERGRSLASMMTNTGTLTEVYNGSTPGTPLYNNYKAKLDTGMATYNAEKASHPPTPTPTRTPPGADAHEHHPGEQFAD